MSGQRLRDGLLAVDPHGAVVLFVHDGLNWTVASAVQLKIITFRCSEINNQLSLVFFPREIAAADRRGLTVDTNEWLGAEVVPGADEGSVLFLRCQRGLCDWRDITRGDVVHRRW